MPNIELTTLLDLVGGLNDSEDPGSASARFRKYLRGNVEFANDLRDYVQVALAHSGDQYNKALQDLINHLGQLLGFDVVYGRYRGVRGEVGYDGLWCSPAGWSIMVETKTTDTYTVKTATLLGYINALISEGQIAELDKVLGLYVYGRFDQGTSQLENAIKAEKRREQLRVVSVEALLDLLALKQEYGLDHDTILGLLLPAPVRVDPLINLISNVVAQEKQESSEGFEPKVKVNIDDEAVDEATATRARSGNRAVLCSIEGDYTGQSVVGIMLNGTYYDVQSWREAAERVFVQLRRQNAQHFDESVLTIVGRKRPYFTRDASLLRTPGQVPEADLFYETNLSANGMVKLCHTVLERMGMDRSVLTFEVET